MKNEILIIEDVLEMSELIKMYLEKSNFSVSTFETAEAALEKLENGYNPDLVILDLNLPGMSGFEFLKKFRTDFKTTIPVIIVSARDSDEDIIKGLGIGADEFVTKPFSPKVLVARVQAKLSRLTVTEAEVEKTETFGEYTLYCNSCSLKKGIERIPLSNKEYEILTYLINHTGETITPEVIFKDVWKNRYGDITAVAVYIQRLRKKIEENTSDPKHIKTVFGQGYKFER